MNRLRTFLVVLAVIPVCSGCGFIAEALLNGLIDSTYASQFDDGREAGGLTKQEERARFEESNIRFMQRDRAYHEEGLVPAVP